MLLRGWHVAGYEPEGGLMSIQSVDLSRVLALLWALGFALLAWVGSQFTSLPGRVTAIETKQTLEGERLNRMEGKIDLILTKVGR